MCVCGRLCRRRVCVFAWESENSAGPDNRFLVSSCSTFVELYIMIFLVRLLEGLFGSACVRRIGVDTSWSLLLALLARSFICLACLFVCLFLFCWIFRGC